MVWDKVLPKDKTTNIKYLIYIKINSMNSCTSVILNSSKR